MGGIITVMVTSRSTCRGELSQTESVNSDYTIYTIVQLCTQEGLLLSSQAGCACNTTSEAP